MEVLHVPPQRRGMNGAKRLKEWSSELLGHGTDIQQMMALAARSA